MVSSDDCLRCGGLLGARRGLLFVGLEAHYRTLDHLDPDLGGLAVEDAGNVFADDVVFIGVDAFGHQNCGALFQAGVPVFGQEAGFLRAEPRLLSLSRLPCRGFVALVHGFVEETVKQSRWSMAPSLHVQQF